MADYTIGSGNIFKDLGFPNPDEELAKVKLASKINRLIEDREMTQKEAADFLGISRSKMTSLRNGRLEKFSIDLLFSLLGKLDYQEVIIMKDELSTIAENELTFATKLLDELNDHMDQSDFDECVEILDILLIDYLKMLERLAKRVPLDMLGKDEKVLSGLSRHEKMLAKLANLTDLDAEPPDADVLQKLIIQQAKKLTKQLTFFAKSTRTPS